MFLGPNVPHAYLAGSHLEYKQYKTFLCHIHILFSYIQNQDDIVFCREDLSIIITL